ALLALLSIARTHPVDREKAWRSGAARLDRDIRFDSLKASLIVRLLVLLLAARLPVLRRSAGASRAPSEVHQPWRRFQDSCTRLFSSLRSHGTTVNDAYADTMVLGGARTVGNARIMDIYVPYELSSVYWQGVVLDTYDGQGGWTNSSNQTINFF